MRKESILKVKFEGPSFKKGRIDLSILGSFCENFQALINGIGQNILQEPPVGKRGKKPKEIREMCRIVLTGFSEGSTVLDLALPGELLQFGEEPVSKFIDGYRQLQKDPTTIPEGFDDRVINKIKAISTTLGSKDRIFYIYKTKGQ